MNHSADDQSVTQQQPRASFPTRLVRSGGLAVALIALGWALGFC